tara:strand:- start:82 stop:633 length:552 start_codon:yes stop_codon:yes gene_type:complete
MNNPVRYIILGFGFFLIFVVGTILYNIGFFKDAVIEGTQEVTFNGVYKDYVGPYHKVLPLFEEVELAVKNLGNSCSKTYGVYLDDPDEVDADRLRAKIGCIVETEVKDLPEGLKFETVGPAPFLKLSFDGSPAAGPLKVYPKADQWILNQGLPKYEFVLEIYISGPNDEYVTEYYFPVTRKAE